MRTYALYDRSRHILQLLLGSLVVMTSAAVVRPPFSPPASARVLSNGSPPVDARGTEERGTRRPRPRLLPRDAPVHVRVSPFQRPRAAASRALLTCRTQWRPWVSSSTAHSCERLMRAQASPCRGGRTLRSTRSSAGSPCTAPGAPRARVAAAGTTSCTSFGATARSPLRASVRVLCESAAVTKSHGFRSAMALGYLAVILSFYVRVSPALHDGRGLLTA